MDRIELPTVAHLRAAMPLLSQPAATKYVPLLRTACGEFEVNTPARMAAFLAQVAHESGQLRHWEEIWGPSPTQRLYEPPGRKAMALGNNTPGDGYRFRGRGPIQITGRYNYATYGRRLGLDLVGSPDVAATPQVGFRIAACFWKHTGLNELADKQTRQAFVRITRRINGGTTGLVERVLFHERVRTAMGLGLLPEGEPVNES